MKPTARFASILLLATQLLATTASAAPISAADALHQFNLIAFGNVSSSSHVDGRTLIGGSVSGGDYAQHPGDAPASSYAGLTVGGDASHLNVNGLGIVTGGNLSNANINSGSAVVLGDASNVNFNGGTAYVGGTPSGTNFNGGQKSGASAASAIADANDALGSIGSLQTELKALSLQLSQLSSTGSSVAISGNRATFNAVADAQGIAVFDLTAIDVKVFSLLEFEFNRNGATTMIFNTDEETYRIAANFLGGSARTIAEYSIWNFYNASTIEITAEFGGTVLAPDAFLKNTANIEGTVVTNTLTQYGEIHLQPFRGDLPGDEPNEVPEPGILLLALSGIAILAGYRRHSLSRFSRRGYASCETASNLTSQLHRT